MCVFKKYRKEDMTSFAKYDIFSNTWNLIIKDLREGDLISNKEMENLLFSKFEWHNSFSTCGFKPIFSPVFVFAGQVNANN